MVHRFQNRGSNLKYSYEFVIHAVKHTTCERIGLQDYLYITCRSLHRHLCKLRNCCKVCHILVHVTTRMTFTIVFHGMGLCFHPLKLDFKRFKINNIDSALFYHPYAFVVCICRYVCVHK